MGGQKKGIYKRFRFLWSHVKVMTLTLFFLINLLLLRRFAYTGNSKSMQHFVPKIQTISVFKVMRQGHDLDLDFFNQSIAFKEIRLPTQQISSQSDISFHQPIFSHFRSPRSHVKVMTLTLIVSISVAPKKI